METATSLSDLPPSKQFFLELTNNGISTIDAAMEAFPEKSKPLDYARKFLKDTEIGRAQAFVAMQEVGLSIRDTIFSLKRCHILAEENPKASTALLNCVTKSFDFYSLMPKQDKANLTINNTQVNVNTPEGREQVVEDYYVEAQEHLPKEEIETFIECGTIGEVEVLRKADLFENEEEVKDVD